MEGRTLVRVAGLVLCILLGCNLSNAEPQRSVAPVPLELRKALRLDAFYEQHVDVHGFPVMGSAKVSPFALLEAAWIIQSMLADRRDILARLVRAGGRCCVMAHDEWTTDVPEHRDLEPAKYWDRRARGLGATRARPCVSCAEENLLGYPGDPYATESILVHEFAHAVDLLALRRMDPTFESRLTAAYETAMKAGRWKGCYASENKEEYWAEGVQSWFDTNRPADAIHNHVNTREELIQYDPALAALIRKAFGDNPWRYARPHLRSNGTAHLAGFDRSKAPQFAWPKALNDWYRRYKHERKTGANRITLPPLPTADVANARSRGTSESTTILFINRLDVDLRIFWIDFDGGRRPYGRVKGGRSNELPTYVGHRWVLVDADGMDVAHFRAASPPGRAVITPPNVRSDERAGS